jgi:hypothetical protein
MGILNFWNNKPQAPTMNITPALPERFSTEFEHELVDKKPTSFDVPQDVFIEYQRPKAPSVDTNGSSEQAVNNLQTLYGYLGQSLEKKGYEDALTNPDTSYMEEHIVYITNEQKLLIAKIKSYYAGYLRNIDFHIETRKRSGMLEVVDELIAHKQTVVEELDKVNSIEQEASKKEGISQNMILSYRRGFRNGFAAITYSAIFKSSNR